MVMPGQVYPIPGQPVDQAAGGLFPPIATAETAGGSMLEATRPVSARSGNKPSVKVLLKEAGLYLEYYETFLDNDVTSLEELA